MAMKQMDDRDLITEYLKGNEKAFEVLLMRHKDKIFRFIHMKLRDRVLAEDVFQETFVKIINTLKLGSYNEEGKFLPWALRIAHNLIIDFYRRQSKVRMISESNSLDEEYSVFYKIAADEKNYLQQTTYDELESQMVHLVSYLPKPQKEMIEMRIFQDLSFKEIAEMENISINTALGRMRYALINIRKLIEKHNIVTEIA